MNKSVIFTLIIILLTVVVIYFLILKISRKIQRNLREISNIADTVSDVISLVKEADKVVATQPKTLSVVESVFLDDLKKDFPELNLDITKSFVQEIITDFLDFCHTGNDAELQKDCTENFIAQAKTFHLEDKISDLKFHKTVIKSYKKRCR